MKIKTDQLIAIALGLAVLVGAALSSTRSPEPIPSLVEAQTLVSDAWKRGVEGDGAGVCNFAAAQGNCRIQLQVADGAWPTDEPTIMCDRELAANGEFSGGYALRVEGVDSRGEPYVSDTLAIGTEDGPRLMNAVFWTSRGIAIGNTTDHTFDVCG